MSSLLHLSGFFYALFHCAQSECPDQSLFTLRQGIVLTGGPAEIVKTLAYANNKLQIALQRGERPQGLDLNDPAQAACVLASWYSDCLEQLINLEDSKIYSPSSMD